MPFHLSRQHVVLLAAARATLLVPAAHAELSSEWSSSGFGTAGLTYQDGGSAFRFSRDRGQVASRSRLSATTDSRLGAQVNWDNRAQWEGGLQAVWSNTPHGTPVAESVQWAYLGYRFNPDTRVRLGRINTDMFLFADSRNVGFALPWIRPPADFYGFMPLNAVNGVDLDQRWGSGDTTWRLRASAGMVQNSVTDLQGGQVPLRGKHVLALGLSREENGLLLKASYVRSRTRIDAGPGPDQLLSAINQLQAVPVPGLGATLEALKPNLWTHGPVTYLGLAAQYETGAWTFIAEGSQLWVPRSPLNARRGYVSAGWHDGAVTYYGLLSRSQPTQSASSTPDIYSTIAPLTGMAQAQQAQALAGYAASVGNSYRYDQGTVAAGIRWDFASNAALKVQWDHFLIRNNGGGGWRFSDGSATHGNLLSVAVDFVLGQ